MQEVSFKGLEQLDQLAKRLEKAPEVLRDARRRAFEEAAPQAKRIVDAHIGGTGKVRSWQTYSVGSKGGYAAVRPKKETYTAPTKKRGNRYAVGAVTNAIVSGHRFPSTRGRKGYKPRIQSGAMKVPGKPFYREAEPEIRALAIQTARKVEQEVLDALAGR